MRGCLALASTSRPAAVTPRPPPEATTTELLLILSAAMLGDAVCTDASVVRRPSACNPTSSVVPPFSNSATMASAKSLALRTFLPTAHSRSIALTAAFGHSSAAVRASALTPPRKARVALLPDKPKSPPVSCTVTNAPPSAVIRAATARLARKASRLIATASSIPFTARRPPRKIRPSASAGTVVTTLAFTPCFAKLTTTAAATPAPSSVTTRRCAPRMPESAIPTGLATTSRTAKRSTPPCAVVSAAVAAALAGAATGAAGWPAARMWSII